MGIIPARNRPTPTHIRLLQFILLVLTGVISYGALIYPLAIRSTALPLQAGDVSPSEYQAPQSLRFISKVRTEDARRVAESAVTPVYASPDPAIARHQIERLRASLQYITLVRDDENSTPEQKQADIAALNDVALKPDTIQQVIALTSTRWDTLKQESLSVLEQVMRRSIREQDVDAVRRSVPTLVSLSLNEEEAGMVTELVMSYISANSLYNADLTEAAKKSAREASVSWK